MFNPKWFVIHNTGGPDHVYLDANNIKRILQDERKMGGYHEIYEGVDGGFWMSELNRLDMKAEHVAHHNSEAVGFAFVGNFNTTVPHNSMLWSAAPHVAGLLRRFNLTPEALIAHRDVPDNDTDCPGKLFTANIFEAFCVMVKTEWGKGA
jgi:hypothetical protein